MIDTNLEKRIELTGESRALWEGSSPFYTEGTLDELKNYFINNISTGYRIDVNKRTGMPVSKVSKSTEKQELVPYEFFEQIGKYIIETFELDDLLTITGTLESNNNDLAYSGRPRESEGSKLYEFWNTLTTDEFKNSKPEDRLNVFKDHEHHLKSPTFYASAEEIRETALWMTGTNFMWQHRLTFSEKYQELNSTIKNLWYTEVCEKEIFPFLERAFQDK